MNILTEFWFWYGIGYGVSAVLAARNWLRKFPEDHVITAGTWAMLGALIWPIFAAGAAFGYLARLSLHD